MENGSCCPGNTKTEKSGCGTGAGKCPCGKAGCDGGCCKKEKSGCAAKLVRGSFLGGIVLFAVLAFSWMVLPFHQTSAQMFKNPASLTATLAAQTEGSGLYATPPFGTTLTDQPFAFVVWNRGDGFRLGMEHKMGFDLVLCFAVAFFLTLLMKKQSCGCEIMFASQVGLIAGLMGYIPSVLWFHFPMKYAALGILDLVVAFALAGFVISRFVLRARGSCKG